jgi:hypothetical protein
MSVVGWVAPNVTVWEHVLVSYVCKVVGVVLLGIGLCFGFWRCGVGDFITRSEEDLCIGNVSGRV